MCRSKRVEQLRNIGIINSTTRSHLVGYFYTIYIMMQGSMNIMQDKTSQCQFDQIQMHYSKQPTTHYTIMKPGTHVVEDTLYSFLVHICFQMVKNLQTQAQSGTTDFQL